ncbi:lipid-A-disaccharide synthase, partial [Bacillus paranthracis]
VGYRVNPVTAAIARRLIQVRYVSLVNLLADAPIIPEYLQQDCTPERLAEGLHRLLTEPGTAEAQRQGFARVMDMLRPPEGTPSAAAAAAVLEMLPRQLQQN